MRLSAHAGRPPAAERSAPATAALRRPRRTHLLEERDHPAPRVRARARVLLVLAVEERVRRVGVDDDVVVDVVLVEQAVERVDVARRDALVGAAEQAEHGAADLRDLVEHRWHAEAPAREPAVEADDAVEHELGTHPRQERLRAAEAEADRDEARRARPLHGGGLRRVRVGLDLRGPRLLDVRHVLEVLVALARAGGAPEVVDRDRVVAGVGEALRELDVEAIEAADVREDDHGGAAGRLGGLRQGGGELGAVRRRQLELLGPGAAGHGRAADEVGGQVRRVGVKGEAHGDSPRLDGAVRAGSYDRSALRGQVGCAPMSILGNRVTRSEDPRFITGTATFGEDVDLPGMLHATFVRAISPHARITGIDTSGVSQIPGARVFTVKSGPAGETAGAGTTIDLPVMPHAMPGLN